MYITARGCRLRNDLYCVEWDVKLYYTIPCMQDITRDDIYMVPTPPGKFLKVLAFFAFPKCWKVLEVGVGSGNLMSVSWKVLEFVLFQI